MKPILQIVLIALLTPLFGSDAFAQNTGSTDPTNSVSNPSSSCTTCAGALWTNSNNANAQDNNYTDANLEPYLSCFQTTCYRSRYLYCSDFNFTIPLNATIQGIKVKTRGKCDTQTAGLDSTIKLAINSLPVGINKASILFWPTNNFNSTYGDNVDLWNYNWSPANINDSTFGVFIKVFNASATNIRMSIDHVTITVYYQLTTGVVLSQTSSPQNFTANYSQQEQTINVSFSGENKTSISVYNILGNLVYEKAVEANGNDVVSETINTSGLSKGIYFVRLSAEGNQQTKKILIQ